MQIDFAGPYITGFINEYAANKKLQHTTNTSQPKNIDVSYEMEYGGICIDRNRDPGSRLICTVIWLYVSGSGPTESTQQSLVSL